MPPKGRGKVRLKDPEPQQFKMSDEAKKEAWAAMSALKSMMPQLRHFAQIVTGNPRIEVAITTDTPHTRGNRIFIRPPLALGRHYTHNRTLCGRRDGRGKQLCLACQVREVIDFFLYHEIGHVVGKSHQDANYADYKELAKFLDKYHPQAVCGHADQMMSALRNNGPTVLSMGVIVSEFLPMLVNSLEDARVNELMFGARPGLRRVFEVNIDGIMTEGIDVGGGDFVLWNKQPLNSQFIIGLYTLAIGYKAEGMFDERVTQALEDAQLNHLASRAATASSVHEIFGIALEVIDRAQDLGFLEVERCTPAPPSLGNPDGSDPQSGSGDSESDGTGDDGSAAEPSDDSDGQVNESGDQSSGSDGGSEAKAEHAEDDPHAPSDAGDSPGGDLGDSERSGNEDEDSSEDDASPASDSDSGSDEASDSDSDSSGDEIEDESDGSTATGQPGDSESSGDAGESDETADSSDGTDSSRTDDEGSSSAELDIEDVGADSSGSSGDSDSQGSESESSDGEISSESTGDSGISDGVSSGVEADADGADDSDNESDESGDSGGRSEDVSLDDPNADDERDVWDDDQADEANDLMHEDAPPEARAFAPLDLGDAEDVARALQRILMHGIDDEGGLLDDMANGDIEAMVGISEEGELDEATIEAITIAVQQGSYFDDASAHVVGVEKPQFPTSALDWDPNDLVQHYRRPKDELASIFSPGEELVGKALLHMRRVLDDNKKTKKVPNLRSGRINTRALGRRAPAGDDRIFQKKQRPGKRDYSVLIGLDGSGSTAMSGRNEKIKRMAFAQADMLSRLGIPFAIYGHTAYTQPLTKIYNGMTSNYWLYMLPIKEFSEPWNDNTKLKLACMQSMADNLDGHTLEFYRKELERREETDRILVYVTDGKMPAANYSEERPILEREVVTCERKKITLLGVGINTDSPKEYGMDTVRVDSDEDIHKVIEQLDRRLTR